MSRISKVRSFGAIVLSILLSFSAFAGKTCPDALIASMQLTAALQNRDTLHIKDLVDPGIVYGHSNGWIETRPEMFRDLYDGTLVYNSIRLLDVPLCRLHGSTATIRHRVAVDIQMRESKLQMNLAVLQVWQYRRKSWILIARQSGKIP